MKYKLLVGIIFLLGMNSIAFGFVEFPEVSYNANNNYFEGEYTLVIGNSSNNITLDYLQGKILTNGVESGGSSNESSQVFGDNNGNITLNNSGLSYEGNARSVKVIQEWAYDLDGNSGMYNGISCASSGLTVLDRITYFKSFDDGGGAGKCETIIWNARLPNDYDEGTNVSVTFPWVSGGTTGDIVWQCGIRAASNGDSMNNNEVYAPAQTITVPGTAFQRTDASFEFDGSTFLKKDVLSIVCLRDADNGADSSGAVSYMSMLNLEYVADDMGTPIQDSILNGNYHPGKIIQKYFPNPMLTTNNSIGIMEDITDSIKRIIEQVITT